MGNFLAPCTCIAKHGKVERVAKPDGKVLEFSSPINVNYIMTKRKEGRLYHLVPSMCSPPIVTNQGNTKRIKVVITKQQLEQLVTKQISIEDILPQVETVGVDLSYKQNPKLETILEEN